MMDSVGGCSVEESVAPATSAKNFKLIKKLLISVD